MDKKCGRKDGGNGQTDEHTYDAKTISLRLCWGIITATCHQDDNESKTTQQDDFKNRKERKYCITNQGPSTNNESNNKQLLNNSRTTALEGTTAEATLGLKLIVLAVYSP